MACALTLSIHLALGLTDRYGRPPLAAPQRSLSRAGPPSCAEVRLYIWIEVGARSSVRASIEARVEVSFVCTPVPVSSPKTVGLGLELATG